MVMSGQLQALGSFPNNFAVHIKILVEETKDMTTKCP
jgi:hypothetical protein